MKTSEVARQINIVRQISPAISLDKDSDLNIVRQSVQEEFHLIKNAGHSLNDRQLLSITAWYTVFVISITVFG